MKALALEHFQSEVAKKHRLGTKLVTGHMKKYFDEASEMYAQHKVAFEINKIDNLKQPKNG